MRPRVGRKTCSTAAALQRILHAPPLSPADRAAERIGSVTTKTPQTMNFSSCLLQILTNSLWARPRAKQKVPDPHHTDSVSPSLPLLSCPVESRNGGEEEEKLPMRPPGSGLRLRTRSSLFPSKVHPSSPPKRGRGVPFEGRGGLKGVAGGCLGSRLFVCVGAERGGVGGREQEIRGRPVRDGGPQEPQSARKTGDVAPLLHRKKTRDAYLGLI